MKPTVSVIVPVYNNCDGIKNILEALNTQDYPQDRYEVLLVDVKNYLNIIMKLLQFK